MNETDLMKNSSSTKMSFTFSIEKIKFYAIHAPLIIIVVIKWNGKEIMKEIWNLYQFFDGFNEFWIFE